MTETEIYPYLIDEVSGDIINRNTGEVVDQVYCAPRLAIYVPCKSIRDTTQLNHALLRKWGADYDLRRPGILYAKLQRKYAYDDLPVVIFNRFIAEMPNRFDSSPQFYEMFEHWCDQHKIVLARHQKHWRITRAIPRDESELKRLCYAVAKSLMVSGANVFLLAQMLTRKLCRVNRVLAGIAGVYYKQRTQGLQYGDKKLAARVCEMSSSGITRGVRECASMFT